MRHSEIRRAEDPLLLAALEGFPHQLPHLPAIPTREAWIFNPGGFGGAYLTVVARAAFGCVRYPGFADRRLLRPSPLTKECFSRLRPEDLERSVAELRGLKVPSAPGYQGHRHRLFTTMFTTCSQDSQRTRLA